MSADEMDLDEIEAHATSYAADGDLEAQTLALVAEIRRLRAELSAVEGRVAAERTQAAAQAWTTDQPPADPKEASCATTTATVSATSDATAPEPGAGSGSATERTVELPSGFREHFGLTGTYATSKTASADQPPAEVCRVCLQPAIDHPVRFGLFTCPAAHITRWTEVSAAGSTDGAGTP